VSYRAFGEKEGFEVNRVDAMLFDDSGWLWIAGQSLRIVNHQINNRELILQRYDGNRFYTIELPDLKIEEFTRLMLFKRNDGKFYVLFDSDTKAEVFLFNPNTLIFNRIDADAFDDAIKISIFPYKENHLAFIYTAIGTKLFRLNKDSKLTFLSDIETSVNPTFPHLIEFEDTFLLEDRNGVHWHQANGKRIETVKLSDLGITDKTLDYNLHISTYFRREGVTYIQFYELSGYFVFNPVTGAWKKTNVLNAEDSNQWDAFEEKKIYTDALGNTFMQTMQDSGVEANIDYLQSKKTIAIDKKSYQFSLVASRDLTKELILEESGTLYHYHFEAKPIQTFLENMSIRGLLQLNEKEVLVATEMSGWFMLNLETNTTQKYELTLNGNPYLPTLNRSIFKTEHGFWSNYDKGIIQVNEQTKAITSYIHFPVATMIEDEHYIYYGTLRYALMRFDKKLGQHTVLVKTPDDDMQAIKKFGQDFYIASKEGLLIYNGKDLQYYKPGSQAGDYFLLSIAYQPKFGLLLGSQSGKLYQFDTQSKVFSVLYDDPLASSIATILFDDKDRIWLNTFRGIVAFNPAEKSSIRYSETDGLSFYEANRYSALKTRDGHFLVGTLKGLNYFHPDEIKKNNLEAALRFVSLDYASQNNQNQSINAPEKIKNIQELNIPPNNKNLRLSFALFGILNLDKVSYRYRLNEQPWINLQNKTEIDLFNLPSGEYKLQVEALNSLNEIIGEPLSLQIIANRFFYETAWFYLLMSLGVLAIGTIIYFEQRKKHLLKAKYATQMIRAQEAERIRISKELHDNIGQKLLLLQMNAQLENTDKNEQLNLLETTLNEVRSISHLMHPFQFEKLGLKNSLNNLMDAFQRSSTVFYSCQLGNIDGHISKEAELIVFRILQECVVNVEKHAEATACKLTAKRKKEQLIFELKDNGKGFLVEQKLASGLGLKSLQERAQYIRAHFQIESEIGKGTTVILKVNTK
jgi:signal transduction histidine kinase